MEGDTGTAMSPDRKGNHEARDNRTGAAGCIERDPGWASAGASAAPNGLTWNGNVAAGIGSTGSAGTTLLSNLSIVLIS